MIDADFLLSWLGAMNGYATNYREPMLIITLKYWP